MVNAKPRRFRASRRLTPPAQRHRGRGSGAIKIRQRPGYGPGGIIKTILLRFCIGATAAAGLGFAILSGCVIPGTGEFDKSVGHNGSFEIVRSGLPVNWYVSRRPIRKGNAEFSVDTTDAVDGKHSLKIVVHGVTDPPSRAPWVFQTRPAEPGAPYAVSFWLKSQACALQVWIRNEGKDPFFGFSEAEKLDHAAHPPVRSTIGGGDTRPDEWRQFRYNYAMPETDDKIRFELRIVRPCTLWLDDVRIEKVGGMYE